MLNILATFAALSMAGTIILSLLPEGGLKRTAGLAVGLLTILAWLEGIAGLLNIPLSSEAPAGVLIPTACNVEAAASQAAAMLEYRWGASP